jgi:hypothetical protein
LLGEPELRPGAHGAASTVDSGKVRLGGKPELRAHQRPLRNCNFATVGVSHVPLTPISFELWD